MKNWQHIIVISMLAVICSCKKSSSDANQNYETRAAKLVQKFGFKETDVPVNSSNYNLIINEQNIDSVEILLEQFEAIRKSSEQLDSAKRAYLEEFEKQYGVNAQTSMREDPYIDDYEGPPFYFVTIGQGSSFYSAIRGFGYVNGPPTQGTINGWLLSGLLPGSTSNKTVNDIPISSISNGVQAWAANFNGTLLAVISYNGVSFSIGYVITVQAFYNRFEKEYVPGGNDSHQFRPFYVQ